MSLVFFVVNFPTFANGRRVDFTETLVSAEYFVWKPQLSGLDQLRHSRFRDQQIRSYRLFRDVRSHLLANNAQRALLFQLSNFLARGLTCNLDLCTQNCVSRDGQ